MGGPRDWTSPAADPAANPEAQLARRLEALRVFDFAGIDQLQIHVNTGPEGVFFPSSDLPLAAAYGLTPPLPVHHPSAYTLAISLRKRHADVTQTTRV